MVFEIQDVFKGAIKRVGYSNEMSIMETMISHEIFIKKSVKEMCNRT